MPVIYICNKHKSVFINLHEFVYTPEVFELLLASEDLDLDQDKKDTDKEENDLGSQSKNKCKYVL